MNYDFLYIHVHGCISREGFAPALKFNSCEVQCSPPVGKGYIAISGKLVETLKQDIEELGDLEKLERVVFYSTTSQPYSLPGPTLLWLMGLKPHPENKDPDWIG